MLDGEAETGYCVVSGYVWPELISAGAAMRLSPFRDVGECGLQRLTRRL